MAWGQIKGISNFNGGDRDLTRFGIGSSSTGHIGTFAIDNVLVMQGATFERELVGKLPGDVDEDMDVDMDDFAAIRDNFQQTVTARAMGDLNGDGIVDFVDFRQWKSNFVPPPGSAAGASVPEPHAALLLSAGAGWLLRCRRRRAC
jgi:hypothetical protein